MKRKFPQLIDQKRWKKTRYNHFKERKETSQILLPDKKITTKTLCEILINIIYIPKDLTFIICFYLDSPLPLNMFGKKSMKFIYLKTIQCYFFLILLQIYF